MFKLKNLLENISLAEKCLDLYDYDQDTVDDMMKQFRISSNAIYPYRYRNEVRFLRLSPSEEKPFTDVTSEIKHICWLIEQGFPVMKLVSMMWRFGHRINRSLPDNRL